MINYVFLALLIIMLFRSKNSITSLIVFLVVMHFVEVVFVELLFGKKFSEKAGLFDTLDIIGNCLFIFAATFYSINGKFADHLDYSCKILSFKPIDLVSFTFISGFVFYVFYNSVVTNSLDYHKIVENNSPIDEYILTIIIIILYCSKSRLLVLLPFTLIALVYMYTGQRLRFLLMSYVLYMLFKDYFRYTLPFKLMLFIALFLSIFLDFYRSQGLSMNSQAIHMSHFGELTVTSMYLIDFVNNFDSSEKFTAGVGLFLGNLLPSSLLPDGYDLKRIVSIAVDVPGGGWLPVWFYSLIGYPGVFFIAIMMSSIARFLHSFLGVVRLKNSIRDLSNICLIIFNSYAVIWFMYSPYVIIKFIVYSILFYFLYRSLIPLRVVTQMQYPSFKLV